MFGIGGSELIIIAVVALLLFGPDKLPQIARTVGRFLRDFKRYQDLMESTIRAEMYASEDSRPDPFKKGKDFREKVQAEQAEQAARATEESPETLATSEEQVATDADLEAVAAEGADVKDIQGEGERSGSDET